MANVSKIDIHSPHWKEESERLIDLAASVGYRVKIIPTKTIADYEKWWERFAVGFVSEFVNERILGGYIQTFCSGGEVRIYWPSDGFNWESLHDHSILRHELVHGIIQAYRFGRNFFSYLIFVTLYILALPAGLTMRGRFERQAYIESIRTLLGSGNYDLIPERLDKIEQEMRGSSYGFMDPIWGGGFGAGGSVRRALNEGKITPENSPLKKIGFVPDYAEGREPPPKF